MANISIGGQISLLQRVASLDLRYGPYSSIADAYDNMGPSGDDVITAGLPFGVTEDDGSVSIYIWTKGEDATQNDCKKLDKEHIVLFNGFIDISVPIKQQSYNDVATKDNIVFLNDRKQFAYRDGLNFYINWKNRYVWSNENLIPYDDVIYIDINDNKAYYYNGTTLTLLASETFVSSINNQAPDENGNVNLTKEHIGLEKVDNTSDTEKVVKGANEDGSGNNITITYETKSDATTKNTALQNAISALQTSVGNLTGLDSTNFGGFSIQSTEADAISNIATIYTADGYTNELLWYMAGTSLSSVKAYRYNGSGTPTLISNDSYDCVDFTGLITDVAALGLKLDKVEVENTDSTDEQQIWSNDAGTDEYAKIDSNGVWGKNLKYQDGTSVKDVKTELAGKMPIKTIDSTPTTGSTNLVTSGGVKQAIDNEAKYKDITEDVSDSSVEKIEITDDNGKTYSTIEIDEITANEDEQIWGNDAGTDTYAKVNSQGVHAKKFFTLDGREVGGSSIPNLIVVDAAGNGDYTSLVDALNNAGDTQTKHVTILVMAGTYEMPPKVSYNAPYVESNRNLTIKGVNRNKCILTCNIGFYDYTIGTDCATLRLTGNVSIENLTIISSNEQYDSKVGTEGYVSTRTGRKAAYSVHLDQGRRVGDVVLVKDCTIINKQMSCIGFGLREDSTIRVENCDLVCEQAAADSEANDYGTIWGHNASGADVGGQRLEIINNRITHKTGRYALRLSFAGQEGTYENLEVSYLLVGNAVNTTDLSQSLLVNGFPEGTCTHDAMSFGNQAETMNINN